MKVVILAGGFGTRISEESHLKPKPMVEIGEKPILWHIMKMYSAYGFNEFVICGGYKQQGTVAGVYFFLAMAGYSSELTPSAVFIPYLVTLDSSGRGGLSCLSPRSSPA